MSSWNDHQTPRSCYFNANVICKSRNGCSYKRKDEKNVFVMGICNDGGWHIFVCGQGLELKKNFSQVNKMLRPNTLWSNFRIFYFLFYLRPINIWSYLAPGGSHKCNYMHASKNTQTCKKLKADCETIHSHYIIRLYIYISFADHRSPHFGVYGSYKPVAHRCLGWRLRCYERSCVCGSVLRFT